MSRQTALVTGSSRGIGQSIACALAESGFGVAVHGREASDELDTARAMVEARGVPATSVAGDLSEPGVIEAVLDQAESALGPLTTLVSNAGVGVLQRADVLETTAESYEHCMALNARAPLFLLQAFARRLLARERDPDLCHAILSISSISAEAASTNRIEYCMSKAAAAMMAKVFAVRLAGDGIQVFDIQPGVIATDMSRAALPAYQKRIDEKQLTLIPRIGTPDDVAKVCVAAATGQMPYMVGQVLRPDGGISQVRL